MMTENQKHRATIMAHNAQADAARVRDISKDMIEAGAKALAERNGSDRWEAFCGISTAVLEAALSSRPEPVNPRWPEPKVYGSFIPCSLPAIGEGSRVEVKPLEWTGKEGGPGCDIYATPSGYHHYTVRHLSDDKFDVILNTDTGSIWFAQEKNGTHHASYADAKAAAQADYEQRILSALRSPPEPVSVVDEKPVICIGQHTLGQLMAGEAVEIDAAILLPASDLSDPELVQRVASSLAGEFKRRISEGAGKPFEETGVTLPQYSIWEGYARAALSVKENNNG